MNYFDFFFPELKRIKAFFFLELKLMELRKSHVQFSIFQKIEKSIKIRNSH